MLSAACGESAPKPYPSRGSAVANGSNNDFCLWKSRKIGHNQVVSQEGCSSVPFNETQPGKEVMVERKIELYDDNDGLIEDEFTLVSIDDCGGVAVYGNRESAPQSLVNAEKALEELPKTQFKLEEIDKSYNEVKKEHLGDDKKNPYAGGFRMEGYSSSSDVFFIHYFRIDNVDRVYDDRASFRLGDKFHLSVSREFMDSTFDLIKDLLFSYDNPFGNWKLNNSDMTKHYINQLKIATELSREQRNLAIKSAERLSYGAQFTFYCHPDGKSPDGEGFYYSYTTLKNMRDFIGCLEGILREKGIPPGIIPESDVQADHWQYCSYRDEANSERFNTEEEQQQLLKQRAVYQLVSGEMHQQS